MRQCAICDKRPVSGKTVTHRGMLKVKGGVGRKTVRVNLRRFRPNLQRVKALVNGTVKRIRVCTSCLRSGRVPLAPRRTKQAAPPARHVPEPGRAAPARGSASG